MHMKTFKILVLNPGSTSTKVSFHENEKCIMETDVFHDSSLLLTFPTINDQLDYRMEVVEDFLRENHIDLTDLDAVVGRGGGCYPIESGIYEINDLLIEDTKNNKGGLYHSSMLGVQMAKRIHDKYGGRMLMMDPPVVDELQDIAKVTGVKGIQKKAVSHALNLKAAARKYAKDIQKPYEECRLIVCHIDGGISITAHENGKMIDGNNAGGGEGPFTPTRMGSMAITELFTSMKNYSHQELRDLCSQAGGLSSYFHTSSSDIVHEMVKKKDSEATLVWNAMIYQVCKWIGMMSVVLKGKVDGIVLTGGLLRFEEIVNQILESCGWIAPIATYPGEFEHETMSSWALEVLKGNVIPKKYFGKNREENLQE